MAEFIDKQAAIEAVCGCVPHSCDIGSCGFACSEANALSKLPAADVRPVVKAQWINLTPPKYREAGKSIFWMCSECKSAACFMAEDLPYSFCPNCGADMREES